jgi:hypothetical protein
MITFYALARTGVHQCNNWSKGPVPPVYVSTFYWPKDIAYHVYHEVGPVMFVDLTVPDEWYEEWLPFLDEAFPSTSLPECIMKIIDAAMGDADTLGATNARTFLTDLGFTPDDYLRLLRDPQWVFWACKPGFVEERFGSLKAALRAGYRP